MSNRLRIVLYAMLLLFCIAVWANIVLILQAIL